MNALALNLSACRSMFCLLVPALMYLPVHPHAAELKKPGPSPSDALFDPSRVIQIEIRLDPKDWHALRTSHRTIDNEDVTGLALKETGYTYYRGDVTIDGRTIKSVGLRKKGSFGSTSASRPAFKINLDKFLDGQELDGLHMLTLNNNLSDPTHARQVLGYSIMRAAGVPAPRCNLARVKVNGEDLGIYSHVESIDKPFIKRHFTKTDGSLFESEIAGELTPRWVYRLVPKWGDNPDGVELRELVDILDKPGPVPLLEIERRVNLDAFLRFWATEVLIGSHDSYSWNGKNFFVYRKSGSGQLHFIPWGRDSVLMEMGSNWGKPIPKSMVAYGRLCQRLWELPEIQDRYRKEMRRLLAQVWDEKSILEDVERLKRLCAAEGKFDSEASKRNFQKIRDFVGTRRQEIVAELDGPIPTWPEFKPESPTPLPVLTGPPMNIHGSFSAILQSSRPTNLFALGTATIEPRTGEKVLSAFSRSGAVAYCASNELNDSSQIELVAADANGGNLWNILFKMDPYYMKPGSLELHYFVVRTRLVRGEPGSPGAKYRSAWNLSGTLELTQVSTNLGGTITGNFTINTTAFEEEKK